MFGSRIYDTVRNILTLCCIYTLTFEKSIKMKIYLTLGTKKNKI